MLGNTIYQNSNARQIAVMFSWAALCLVFALNAGNIGIAEFMDFIKKNVYIQEWFEGVPSFMFCPTIAGGLSTQSLFSEEEGKTKSHFRVISCSMQIADTIQTVVAPGWHHIELWGSNADHRWQTFVAWTWYAMVAASCCIACMVTRVLLMFIQGPDVGALMAILFNAGLAVVISWFLESVDTIDMGTHNTSAEEVILSSTAGYFFYEMFYLHTRKSLEPSLKILAMVSATSFIMTSLGNGTGASVVLTFLFLFSSAVPVLKLPYFGSSKFENTTAYKASIWGAYAFSVHQRIIHAPGLMLMFLNSPAFRFEQFECAYYVFLYSLAIGVCFGLVEIVHKRQVEEEKKILEDEQLKNIPANRKLVTYKRSKRAYAYE